MTGKELAHRRRTPSTSAVQTKQHCKRHLHDFGLAEYTVNNSFDVTDEERKKKEKQKELKTMVEKKMRTNKNKSRLQL